MPTSICPGLYQSVWIISFMHVYAFLLLCFISIFASLDLGFAMLFSLLGLLLVSLWGHLLVWLHLSLSWLVWMWPFMRHIFVMWVCLIHTFLRSVQWCYAFLAYFVPPIWLSLLLCIFARLLHVHAWVCVSSVPQSHGTMDIWSKLTFVLLGQPPLLDNMFVCPRLAPFDSLSFSMLSF